MKDSFSLTRRGLLSLLAVGGVTSSLMRRGVLPLLGAGRVGSETAGQEKAPDLGRLCASPVTVEFPRAEPRVLTPGASRRILDAEITEFPKAGPLAIRQVVRELGGGVLERSLEVLADQDATFNLELPYEFPQAESFYSWMRKEEARVSLAHDKLESLKPGDAVQPHTGAANYVGATSQPGESVQLFPFAGAVEGAWLTGAISDTPGFWENRSQQVIDPAERRILLRTGDGSPERVTTGTSDPNYLRLYHAQFDGWQHIRNGQLLRFHTWLFTAPVRDLYDVQLAAHRALATAKGWNSSALRAILCNTAYLEIRRNLTRPEGRYIISSGPNYGWHQWVSDMGMTGLALQDLEILAEGVRGVYATRGFGEDHAMWYLILSALIVRGGFHPNLAQCRRYLEYIRDHEKDGAFIPPNSIDPKNLGWKTQMDTFFYADGDAPASNQGFYCGALMGAQELGFPVSDRDLRQAETAYANMFNHQGGYFPTSMMRPEVFGGDALYGEAVSFAAFGKKALPDNLVVKHCRHAMKIESPYGIRAFSKANGDFLEVDQYGPRGGRPIGGHSLRRRRVPTYKGAVGSSAIPALGCPGWHMALLRPSWIRYSFAVSRLSFSTSRHSASLSTHGRDSLTAMPCMARVRSTRGCAPRSASGWDTRALIPWTRRLISSCGIARRLRIANHRRTHGIHRSPRRPVAPRDRRRHDH